MKKLMGLMLLLAPDTSTAGGVPVEGEGSNGVDDDPDNEIEIAAQPPSNPNKGKHPQVRPPQPPPRPQPATPRAPQGQPLFAVSLGELSAQQRAGFVKELAGEVSTHYGPTLTKAAADRASEAVIKSIDNQLSGMAKSIRNDVKLAIDGITVPPITPTDVQGAFEAASRDAEATHRLGDAMRPVVMEAVGADVDRQSTAAAEKAVERALAPLNPRKRVNNAWASLVQDVGDVVKRPLGDLVRVVPTAVLAHVGTGLLARKVPYVGRLWTRIALPTATVGAVELGSWLARRPRAEKKSDAGN